MEDKQSTTQHWTDALFEQHRKIGDPSADGVIEHILRDHDVQEINRLMRTMVENDDLPLAALPQVVVDYLESTFVLPLWTDPAKLRRATRLFNLHGPEIMMLLFAASLPVLYAKQQGVPVLAITRKLSDVTTFQRRIVETAQFLMDVTDQSAFTDNGRAIRTVQKVRLMHAAVRHYIRHDERWASNWDAAWGTPINQSDLAGTMLSFSVTVVEGLEKAGIHVSDADKEAYLHLWKLIGHIMGIVPALMPETYVDGVAMMNKWMSRRHGASESGTLLTRTLLDFMHERVPGRRFDSYTTNWMRFWLGDPLCDDLGVPPSDSLMTFIHVQRALWRIENHVAALSPLVHWVTRLFSRRLLMALVEIERDGKDIEFRIPERLQAQWGLHTEHDP